MRKYLSGVDYKLLVVPAGTPVPDPIATYFDNIVYSHMYHDVRGYIAQQLDKMDAYRYVNTDHILFSDSDCIYTGPFTPQLLIQNKQPVLYMTPYTQLNDQAVAWQKVVKKHLGFSPTHEFMRAFPILHRTRTLELLQQDYPQVIIQAKKIQDNAFSEFNIIGAYAWMKQHPYHFTEDCKPLPCRQFWSWGGIETVREQVEACIGDTHVSME